MYRRPRLRLCLYMFINVDQCKSIDIVTLFHPIKVLIHKILTCVDMFGDSGLVILS